MESLIKLSGFTDPFRRLLQPDLQALATPLATPLSTLFLQLAG
jgi:hypothetical protein